MNLFNLQQNKTQIPNLLSFLGIETPFKIKLMTKMRLFSIFLQITAATNVTKFHILIVVDENIFLIFFLLTIHIWDALLW